MQVWGWMLHRSLTGTALTPTFFVMSRSPLFLNSRLQCRPIPVIVKSTTFIFYILGPAKPLQWFSVPAADVLVGIVGALRNVYLTLLCQPSV